MDQKKTGSFLRELRKEKQLTQEQLAERFGVTNRSVSRWETGSNMPDLSILVELADFYDVDIRDIIDGERKGEDMNKEEKERLVDLIKKREAGAADSLSNLCRHRQKLQQEIMNLPSRMPRTVRMHI